MFWCATCTYAESGAAGPYKILVTVTRAGPGRSIPSPLTTRIQTGQTAVHVDRLGSHWQPRLDTDAPVLGDSDSDRDRDSPAAGHGNQTQSWAESLVTWKRYHPVVPWRAVSPAGAAATASASDSESECLEFSPSLTRVSPGLCCQHQQSGECI